MAHEDQAPHRPQVDRKQTHLARKQLAINQVRKAWEQMNAEGATVDPATKELYRAIMEQVARKEPVRTADLQALPCLAVGETRNTTSMQCSSGTRKKRVITTACKNERMTRWKHFDNRCHVGEEPVGECAKWFAKYRKDMNASRKNRRKNRAV